MSDAVMLDQLLEPFAQCLDAESARRVADFRIAAPVEQRVHELAERANEGLLTSEERSEYEALINAAEFIQILRLKAQEQLTSKAHP